MKITLAELVADHFSSCLDVHNMTQLQHRILHAIKNVATAQMIREYLRSVQEVSL